MAEIDELIKLLNKAVLANYGEDLDQIKELIILLSKIKENKITIDELEDAYLIAKNLDIKYEEFYDLLYYFNPIYIKYKRIIHNDEVKEIRKNNQKKREVK